LVRVTQSGSQGDYAFQFLPIGDYTITVTAPGFRTEQRTHIELVAAQDLKLDLPLQAQNVNTQIIVTGESPAMDTSTSADNSTLSYQQVNDLPLARMNWTNLLTQAPGATKLNASTNAAITGGITLNGLPTAGFNLTVDSTNAAADPEIPSFGFYQSPNLINTVANDAIQEVDITKGVIPATFSGGMSGGINIVTKSGSNQIHGSLFALNEVSALDARNYFVIKKPRTTFNEDGGGIGGPIIHDKLFAFGAYEIARLSQDSPISGTVPTPYLRNIAPAIFTTTLNRLPSIAQPSSDPAVCATTTSATTGCTSSGTYLGIAPLRQFDNSTVLRLDSVLNPENTAYIRYTRDRPYKYQGMLNTKNSQVTTAHSDVYNAGFLHQFSRVASNSRFGYNRLRLTRADQGLDIDEENITYSGISTVNSEVFVKMGRIVTGDQQFAMIWGKHNLQFGGIIQRNDSGRTDINTASFKYSTQAQFLANTPSSLTINFDKTAFDLYQWQYGGYIQDDYKMSSNLTLNLGIRYDYFTVIKEASGRLFNRGYDPTYGQGFGPFLPANQPYNADFRTGIQPRLGFAYSMFDGKTMLRGGFAILTGRRPFFGGPIEISPTSATAPAQLNLTASQIAKAGLGFPIPRSQFATVLTQLQSSGAIGTSFAGTALAPHFPNPYSEQWYLGIEQALPAQFLLNVAYAGNHGLNENITYIDNAPTRATGVSPNPAFGTFRFYYAGDASFYNSMQVNLRKPMRYGVLLSANYTWAHSLSYGDANLLQDSTPQDINNMAAEYGPSLVDIRDNFTANVLWMIPTEKWLSNKSPAARLLGSGWRLSSVINANTGLPINVINGASAYAGDRPDIIGNPYNYTYHSTSTHTYLVKNAFSAPALNSGSVQVRGGDLHRNAIRSIGGATVDMTAGKDFAIREGMFLDFHVDAFNAFNHTNFTGIVSDISSGSFGNFTSATSRTVQLGGKFTF
jgi:outer membrane receptor protein involved in Fe transport